MHRNASRNQSYREFFRLGGLRDRDRDTERLLSPQPPRRGGGGESRLGGGGLRSLSIPLPLPLPPLVGGGLDSPRQ